MADKEKAAKFKELGSKRMVKALGAIKLVGQIANKGNYEYTTDQAKQIVSDLKAAVASVEKAFASGKPETASAGYSL